MVYRFKYTENQCNCKKKSQDMSYLQFFIHNDFLFETDKFKAHDLYIDEQV